MPRRRLTAAGCALLLLAACTSTSTGHPKGVATPDPSNSPTPPISTPKTTSAPPATRATSGTAPAPVTTAQGALSAMSEAQRVGQLFMVDCPSTYVRQATLDAIAQYHVGSVILDGTSYLSVQQTAAITASLQAEAPRGIGLFISTDQEGGEVQRLQGPGFSSVPSAVIQGTFDASTLRADAKLWGSQLRRAGINVDLAPVLDTVPPNFGSNPPIGDLDREYGRTPAAVTSHGIAVAKGLADAGVDATVKHFPGLGRTAGNTDVSMGVLDTVTTRHDAYLAPFAAAVAGGVAFVMMSTATYTKIDSRQPAAFSPTIVTDMLRGDLGFRGVIISDDIGIAKQVSGYSLGGRAIAFIAAGGDMALTVDATQAGEMASAVLARTRTDAAFRGQVNAAALTVLQAKQALGLLG